MVLLVGLVTGQREIVYGPLNGNVTLSPKTPPFREITWTKNKDKVTEWKNGSKPRVFPPFEGRIGLNTTSAALTIYNLTISDEGIYELYNIQEYTLCVVERLPHPLINYTSTDDSYIFRCWIPESYQGNLSIVQFSWNCSVPKCAYSSTSEIRLKKTEPDLQEVQCTISNPVSRETSSIPWPTESSGKTPMYIIVGILVILSLAVGVVVCCYKKRDKISSLWTEITQRLGRNKDQASGSPKDPKPNCNGTEGNMDQGLKLLQEPNPTSGIAEGESDTCL